MNDNEYEYEYKYNFFLYLWEMNKYFLFGLNEYICEYDYKYFRIYFHSALLIARAWNYPLASGISVLIEYVFSYNPDLLVSKRNRLTATVRKIFCLRAWLKFGKHDCTKEKNIADAFGECIK